MSEQKNRPLVGIGVLIQNDKKEILLGERLGSHGVGEWCFPGGHLEFGETIFETAKRETFEETSLVVDDLELISVSDDFRYIKTDNKHYVTIGVKAKYQGGEIKLMEPEKCREWKWFSLDSLPDNLFEGTSLMINNYKASRIYK